MKNYNQQKQFLIYATHQTYYNYLKTELNKYIQHGRTTTFKHSRNVAYNSYKIANYLNKKFKVNIDFESLIDSAYMHDFYLYDWHEPSKTHRLHGFTHPKEAAKNAKIYFNVSPKVIKLIKSHMWPLTITKVPTSREAWILTLSDKFITIYEVFTKNRA